MTTSAVACCDASQVAGWDEYVTSHPEGTFCHLAGWGNVVQRTWNYRRLDLVARRGGAIVGVLPLFGVRSWLFGSRLISVPNGVYGGIVADDADVRKQLEDAALGLARKHKARFVELRDVRPIRDTTPSRSIYARFECELPSDPDVLMASFPSDVRRMIRVGIKAGLVTQFGRELLLDEFYDVYATSVRNLGTPVFPRNLFAEFLREFPQTTDVLVIRTGDGRVTAAVLSFYFRGTVHPYYGGSYPEFQKAGVNNFMYWSLMCRAITRGCARFDFGRSKVGTGAHAFKRGWKMREEALHYRHLGPNRPPSIDLTPLNPRLAPFISAWRRLPVSVTKLIGPAVVRHLP